MTLEQLVGKYMRLRAELCDAYTARTWSTDHVDRLSDEIVFTERTLAAAQPLDEQTNDPLLAGLFL